MSIKGTLETFNLRELLQMLAFNQKVGTLILESERGPRTVYVDRGRVSFVSGDPQADEALLRVVHRRGIVPPDRLDRALQIHRSSGRHLATVLKELGACDAQALAHATLVAAEERFLDLQLTSVSHFEFADGRALAPDGREAEPMEPSLVVDSLLLDLTRKMDQWAELTRVVPGTGEVYETTGVAAELSQVLSEQEVDAALADRVIGAYDGFRTLDQIVEVSFADPLTVLEVTAALVHTGSIRPVPIEDLLTRAGDLLSRGEAQQALPLYRRAVEREGAPPAARLHLAEALEATGERTAAALELETFAALNDGAEPRVVFDGLLRALRLRDGDLAAASRACDFYLRNRPWLEDRLDGALEALRMLIHGAVTNRKPLEAAGRLRLFVTNGDSPSEDLLVLADLYASGGARDEAAAALFRRAEDLLTKGRTQAGRELLERTLQLDPSRSDARSRLHLLLGAQGRKRRRKRLFVFMLLLGLLLLGAGAAWWAYNQEANLALRQVRENAEMAVTRVESRAYGLLDAFADRLKRAATASEPDPGLASASEKMLEQVRGALAGADPEIYAFATELERYRTTDPQDTYAVMFRQLNSSRETALRRAESIVAEARERGQQSLVAGEDAHRKGRFEEAKTRLLEARNLSFGDAALASRAAVLLSNVEGYIREFETAWKAQQAATSAREAYRLGVELLAAKLDSDLTRRVRLPLDLTTTPIGATVRLGGETLDVTPPCRISYSPFGGTELTVRAPGRVPFHAHLPAFQDIVESPSECLAWEPVVTVHLQPGPCWSIPAESGPFTRLWISSGAPVLAAASGRTLQTVDLVRGQIGARIQIRRPSPVRHGGSAAGIEWRLVGNHTLVVRPRDGEAWETAVLGRLAREPIVVQGLLIAVDESGSVYGLDVQTGAERWRRHLQCRPCHAPKRSPLGVLVPTYEAGVFVLDPGTGKPKNLAIDSRGLTLAAPLGDGVVLIGGSAGEVRRIAANGKVSSTGAAHPLDRGGPWIGSGGVAWIEEDGVRWLGDGDSQPTTVRGLGPDVRSLSGDRGVLYAAGADGVVRAVSLDAPETTLWEAHAGTEITAPPLPIGDLLLVLVDGGLKAVAR